MLKLLEISPVLGQGWVNILARSDSFLALACFIRVSVLWPWWPSPGKLLFSPSPVNKYDHFAK